MILILLLLLGVARASVQFTHLVALDDTEDVALRTAAAEDHRLWWLCHNGVFDATSNLVLSIAVVESDVDCGGECAARFGATCRLGLACAADADCAPGYRCANHSASSSLRCLVDLNGPCEYPFDFAYINVETPLTAEEVYYGEKLAEVGWSESLSDASDVCAGALVCRAQRCRLPSFSCSQVLTKYDCIDNYCAWCNEAVANTSCAEVVTTSAATSGGACVEWRASDPTAEASALLDGIWASFDPIVFADASNSSIVNCSYPYYLYSNCKLSCNESAGFIDDKRGRCMRCPPPYVVSGSKCVDYCTQWTSNASFCHSLGDECYHSSDVFDYANNVCFNRFRYPNFDWRNCYLTFNTDSCSWPHPDYTYALSTVWSTIDQECALYSKYDDNGYACRQKASDGCRVCPLSISPTGRLYFRCIASNDVATIKSCRTWPSFMPQLRPFKLAPQFVNATTKRARVTLPFHFPIVFTGPVYIRSTNNMMCPTCAQEYHVNSFMWRDFMNLVNSIPDNLWANAAVAYVGSRHRVYAHSDAPEPLLNGSLPFYSTVLVIYSNGVRLSPQSTFNITISDYNSYTLNSFIADAYGNRIVIDTVTSYFYETLGNDTSSANCYDYMYSPTAANVVNSNRSICPSNHFSVAGDGTWYGLTSVEPPLAFHGCVWCAPLERFGRYCGTISTMGFDLSNRDNEVRGLRCSSLDPLLLPSSCTRTIGCDNFEPSNWCDYDACGWSYTSAHDFGRNCPRNIDLATGGTTDSAEGKTVLDPMTLISTTITTYSARSGSCFDKDLAAEFFTAASRTIAMHHLRTSSPDDVYRVVSSFRLRNDESVLLDATDCSSTTTIGQALGAAISRLYVRVTISRCSVGFYLVEANDTSPTTTTPRAPADIDDVVSNFPPLFFSVWDFVKIDEGDVIEEKTVKLCGSYTYDLTPENSLSLTNAALRWRASTLLQYHDGSNSVADDAIIDAIETRASGGGQACVSVDVWRLALLGIENFEGDVRAPRLRLKFDPSCTSHGPIVSKAQIANTTTPLPAPMTCASSLTGDCELDVASHEPARLAATACTDEDFDSRIGHFACLNSTHVALCDRCSPVVCECPPTYRCLSTLTSTHACAGSFPDEIATFDKTYVNEGDQYFLIKFAALPLKEWKDSRQAIGVNYTRGGTALPFIYSDVALRDWILLAPPKLGSLYYKKALSEDEFGTTWETDERTLLDVSEHGYAIVPYGATLEYSPNEEMGDEDYFVMAATPVHTLAAHNWISCLPPVVVQMSGRQELRDAAHALGAIVFIAPALSIICLCICFTVAFLCMRARRVGKMNQHMRAQLTSLAAQEAASSAVVQRQLQTIGFDPRFIIDASEVELQDVIGEGSFGVVRRGVYRNMIVAVKQIRRGNADDDEAAHRAEEALLKEAQQLQHIRPHANLVTMYGVCSAKPVALIAEFCARGSLDDALYGAAPHPFSPSDLLRIVTDVAKGVLHLHMERVIHRDLAARNILLSSAFVAKLSDFGMARQDAGDDGGSNQTKNTIGPIKWQAPEQIESESKTFSFSSDVWSYAIVCYECYAREPPWASLSNMGAAKKIFSGIVLPVPPSTHPVVANVMREAWRQDPQARPTMQVIVRQLLAIGDGEGGGGGGGGGVVGGGVGGGGGAPKDSYTSGELVRDGVATAPNSYEALTLAPLQLQMQNHSQQEQLRLQEQQQHAYEALTLRPEELSAQVQLYDIVPNCPDVFYDSKRKTPFVRRSRSSTGEMTVVAIYRTDGSGEIPTNDDEGSIEDEQGAQRHYQSISHFAADDGDDDGGGDDGGDADGGPAGKARNELHRVRQFMRPFDIKNESPLFRDAYQPHMSRRVAIERIRNALPRRTFIVRVSTRGVNMFTVHYVDAQDKRTIKSSLVYFTLTGYTMEPPSADGTAGMFTYSTLIDCLTAYGVVDPIFDR